MDQFSRIEMLLGKNIGTKLKNASIAIFGIGGVGGYAVEALARSGIYNFLLVDDDVICLTNINRQIIATHNTIGQSKTQVMKDRILDINPKANVIAIDSFYDKDTANNFDIKNYDYIVDAIDTVSSKLLLIKKAYESNTKIISCMGMGNKLDPSLIEVTDIYKTSMCPLAKVMRKELKNLQIKKLTVVYSKEKPIKPINTEETSCLSNCVCPKASSKHCLKKRQVPGSTAFVPPAAGLFIAAKIIKDLGEY